MSNEKLEAGLASHLTQELGCEYELKEPKNTKHYKPLETPAAYPLELLTTRITRKYPQQN
jgi:hypothetical protein